MSILRFPFAYFSALAALTIWIVPARVTPRLSPQAVLGEASATAETAPARDALMKYVAPLYGRIGRADEALRIAETIQNRNERSLVTCGIGIAQATAGDIDGSLRICRDSRCINKQHIVAVIAARRAFAGDLNGAIQLIKEELKVNTLEYAQCLKILGYALEQAEDYAGAVRVYDLLPDSIDQVRSRRASARNLIRKGNFSGAIRKADELRSIAYAVRERDRSIQIAQPSHLKAMIDPEAMRDRIVAEVALAQGRAGDVPGARKSAGGLNSPDRKCIVLAQLGAHCATEGDRKTTSELLAQAAEIVKEERQPLAKAYELAEIATVYALLGEMTRARRTFHQAIAMAGMPTHQGQIATMQARAGDIEDSIRAIEAVPDESVRDEARVRLSVIQAESHNIEAAIRNAGKISTSDGQARALLAVAERQDRSGDRQGALETLGIIIKVNGILQSSTARLVTKDFATFGSAAEAHAWASAQVSTANKVQALLGLVDGLLPAPLHVLDFQIEGL